MPLDVGGLGKETGWISKWAMMVSALAADAIGRQAIEDGYFAATSAMRAKFADDFVNNDKIATPNHEIVVQAHKTTVAINQADVEIFEWTAPRAMTLSEVQVYCTATAATASVDVKEAGTTVLAAAATPTAGSPVKPTVSDSAIAAGAAITVHVTTNGTGTITDLTVSLRLKFEIIA